MYLVAMFIAAPDPEALPINVLVASDHATYIGVVTNLVIAMLLLEGSRATRWPWADHIAFWAVNAGLLVFVIGLIVDTAELKRVGAPVMGVALLSTPAVHALRLRGPVEEPTAPA